MYKSGPERWESPAACGEPIPTYEESISAVPASARAPPPREKPNSSVSSLLRQGRTRRISNLISDTVLPTLSISLANGCAHSTLILLPSDALEINSRLDEQNIVTPGRQDFEGPRSVVVLHGQDNCASFWTQDAVVHELDLLLRKELGCPAPPSEAPLVTERPESEYPSHTPMQPLPQDGTLPARPEKKSWLKRSAAVAKPEKDPTGETGSWNLGWRSPETHGGSGAGSAHQDALRRHHKRTTKLEVDQVALDTRLQDVSFRTENEMGLFQTTTVKCIWVGIDVGT